MGWFYIWDLLMLGQRVRVTDVINNIIIKEVPWRKDRIKDVD